MKQIILLLLIAISFGLKAQEIHSLSAPFGKGNISFEYYEKDGVKIPHGIMEYDSEYYSEKGENKNGYKEGTWNIVSKKGNTVSKIIHNYKNGLLEGKSIFSIYKINKSTKKEELESIEEYTFIKGHLYGENKIVVSDTLYCNFNDKGERTGKWILKAKDITVAEYSAYNENVLDCYKLDILGQKTPYENFLFHNTSVLKLVLFKDKIQYIPNTLRESRPELPSLCKIKYGYQEATKPIIE